MSAFTEGKQKVFDILKNSNVNDSIYYEVGIGQGYSIIGRKNGNNIELLELDYSHNYNETRANFINGYKKFVLPEQPKV